MYKSPVDREDILDPNTLFLFMGGRKNYGQYPTYLRHKGSKVKSVPIGKRAEGRWDSEEYGVS